MKPALRHTYNVIRTVLVTALVASFAIYVLLYVLLCIPAVQNKIKTEGEEFLSEYLKTHVTIGDINIKPFNQVVLHGVNIPDQENNELFHIDKLGAGIDLSKLIFDQQIVVTYGEIDGLHGHITRRDKHSPTNMQFIVDALKSKDGKSQSKYDIAIKHVAIRNSNVSYEVLSEPRKTNGIFDVNHLSLDRIRADLEAPQIKNDAYKIIVKHLSFKEQSGLTLKHFSATAEVNNKKSALSNIELEFPGTFLTPNDQVLEYDSLKVIVQAFKQKPLDINLKDNYITPSDFKALLPALSKFSDTYQITAIVGGTPAELNLAKLSVHAVNNGISLDVARSTLYNLDEIHELIFKIPVFSIHANASEISKITNTFLTLKPTVKAIIGNCGDVAVRGAVEGTFSDIGFDGDLKTGLGNLKLKGNFVKDLNGTLDFDGHVETPLFKIGKILSNFNLFDEISMNADVKAVIKKTRLEQGKFKGNIAFVDFKGYRYRNINADVEGKQNEYSGKLAIDDPNGRLDVAGKALLAGINSQLDVEVDARGVNLSRMKLMPGPNNVFSLKMNASVVGNSLGNIAGRVSVNDISFVDNKGKKYNLNKLSVETDNSSSVQRLFLNSDFLHGSIVGQYDLKTLVPAVKGVLAKTFPTLFARFAKYATTRSKNNFVFNFEVEPNDEFMALFKLPVKLLYKATVNGVLNIPDNILSINVDAPYIQQGEKLIEGTSVSASYDEEANSVFANIHSLFPSKNGKIVVNVDANGANNRIDAELTWKYSRERDYRGTLSTAVVLTKSDRGILTEIDINPSEIVVNDTVWNVHQGMVNIDHGVIDVNGVGASRDEQFINVEGRVSKNASDELVLNLQNIDLDYVFETLNISNVTFGGHATGTFYASNLLSSAPRLETPDLHIENMKYNGALMGNGDIESHWDNEEKAVVMNAEISQFNGKHSFVNGAIFPSQDSLYFDFRADEANIEFMKPFMAAFTSDVRGAASGHAVLFGNFRRIDLYGDLMVKDLKFKLDFTNVVYSCTDSIHMTPGNIKFTNVKLHDRDGHKAVMNGWVKHDHFHTPEFNFSITNARDLLCYDTYAGMNPNWYGTIYGNGAAFITGEPGIVNIKANMQSAPRSKFTFVLSDTEVASEYNFITYRDREQLNTHADTAVVEDVVDEIVPEVVRQFTKKIQKAQQSTPTNYMIDLSADITPDLNMVLVMDPIGGDKIRATGNGNLRMTYNNSDDHLDMYGKYVLDKGSYNFTLQDIIIKDFTIRDGSSISFQGNPYAAILDIEAIYSLNANIKDLDASFANSPEINRTNVPVHALLRAKGAMSQPEISFDLEFPTLSSEAYRKIKSIVSTEDMMSRQIIYLLALNRFYTPDYMDTETNNNGFSSVASSTISSQLSKMLGQLNENWSISPNFRTNKGDFSDVEVDLALSSRLLNNRLLFNGNFGYRDNTYNAGNSNFIGDFDVEYLLNSKGSLRLKAYNHFNDQNYYVRNALTTQGVGIVLKHDFDKWFDFLKKKKPSRPDTLMQRRPVSSSTTDTTSNSKP